MKIIHKEYVKRVGQTVPLKEIRNGDVFTCNLSGSSQSFLWKGARYNLGVCKRETELPPSSTYKEWNTWLIHQDYTAVIVEPEPKYLETIQKIKSL